MVGQGGHDAGVEPDDRAAARPRFAVRAYERAGGQRPLLIAAAVGFVGWMAGSTWLFTVAGKCGIVHLASQLGGSAERFSWLTQGCSIPATTQQFLVPDFLLMSGYWLMLSAVLIGGWWRFEAPALRRASWALWLPTFVAAVDIIEYFLLIQWFYKGSDGVFHLRGDAGPVLSWAQVTVSWTKWVFVAAMVIASLMAAGVWFWRRGDHFPPSDTPMPVHRETRRRVESVGGGQHDGVSFTEAAEPGQRVGICLSGSGIRSTAFSLGVLSTLEAGSPDLAVAPARSARHLAAVSGGAWAATAWTLQKAAHPGRAAADAVIEGLDADAVPAGYTRHHHLLNGRGGALGALGAMLTSVFTNLMLCGLTIYLLAWTLGWTVTFCPIDAGRLGPETCGESTPAPPDLLYAPVVVYAVLGLLWLIGCGFGYRRVARLWPVGFALLGLSVFSAVILLVFPRLFALTGAWIPVAAAISVTAIAAAVAVSVAVGSRQVFGGPSVPRLLGIVLLLLGGCAWALIVMYVVARSTLDVPTPWGRWHLSMLHPAAVVIPAAALLGMFAFLGPNSPSLHGLLSARLRRSFDPVLSPFTGAARDPEIQDGDPVPGTWSWLSTKSEVPELILCCSRQLNGTSRGGRRADRFTISPQFVRQGDTGSCETDVYVALADRTMRHPFGRRDRGSLDHVSTWLAATGAVSSSARRQKSAGDADALVAAVNADVGLWLPNVETVPGNGDGPADLGRKLFPRPTFAHTMKKILGWFDVGDRYVFVTDGGHWDNLGLVELLRRNCDVVYCVDATADSTGAFSTLHQTLRLAALQLGYEYNAAELDRCLDALSPKAGSIPATAAVTFTLESAGRSSATPMRSVTIHYIRLQATRSMNVDLKRRAVDDPTFPHYPAMGELLSREQYRSLVELGRGAGADALRCAELAEREHDSALTCPVNAAVAT